MDPEKSINMEEKEQRQLPSDSATHDTTHQVRDPQSHPKSEIETPAALSSSSSSTASVPRSAADQVEDARQENPNGLTRVSTGVSVERAEADFAELQRELSSLSRGSRRRQHADPEKGTATPDSTEEEQFDLEEYLRGGLSAAQDAGIKPKHMGVYWDGLKVRGIGGMSNYVQTFPDVVVGFFNYWTPLMKLLGKGPKLPEVTILDNFRGLCKPGEMVLVLGKPGSGCTTFLKTIANQRFGYTGVEGDVRYGPYTAKEFEQYRGEAVYNQEDDIHHATLTVEQTLGFAIDTKLARKLPAGSTKSKFKQDLITLMLKMFNIEHTRNTVVGGHFVRGVSGGEKKRVSVAEMLCTNACILSWDNSTRGLDASTALDFVKSLRIQSNLYQTTTFVSLYQASENIYNLFDKVLVIDAGKQVYFGPAKDARVYFESLGFAPKPRQTSADYLCGCTDEFEREYAEGRSEEDAPHSPETLAEAFNKSSHSERMLSEMTTYKENLEREEERHANFRTAVKESKQRGAKKSVYTVPFHLQVWALMKRQFILKWQDKTALTLSWLRSIIIAIVLATLYLQLPVTTGSAFGKGGLLFISLLFNTFQAFSELPGTMLGRGVIAKHKAYAFHRPSAQWIAQIIVDQAFSVPQIIVFSLIVYFTTGLSRSAGAFFIFVLMIHAGFLAMSLIFRVIGCLSPDFDYAIKFAVIIITLMVITAGYIIGYPTMKVWLRWIYYINPLGLAFSAMMENEFGRIVMECTSETLIPAGSGYTDVNSQVCTLPGSVPGSTTVSGTDYLYAAFAWKPEELWRNYGIIMALVILLLCLNVLFGEIVNFGAGGSSFRMYKKPDESRKALNEELIAKRDQRRSLKQKEAAGSDLKINSKSILTWEGLNYDVPVPGGNRRLLNNVFGYVKPGQLTALMGASGAGKTTLLDVLAARKNIGVIQGDILVDGMKPGKQFQRSTSYAEQMDMHDPSQSVREALRFSADLRQPFDTPQAEKYAYVEEIIGLLEMEELADAIIGVEGFGLTVEQRKRVTIGVELAAKPELLLFLDEPTSGLDSQSAFNIVRFLKKLARSGQAILCTIHQPNAALFENFDRLLLLKSGGRCVYFGDIGKDAVVLRDYLKHHGAAARESDNVAEFMLEAIGAGSAPRIGKKDWADIWEESPELANVKDTISQLKAQREADGRSVNHELEKEFASPFSHQAKVVLKRTNVSLWRSPNYLFTRLFNHLAIAILTGLTYLQLDTSRTSLQSKVFVMFQVTVLPALIISQVEVMFHIKRSIFFRESSSKMYSAIVFAGSLLVAEMPYSLLCAVGFFIPLYYMPGFQVESSRAGYQFFIVLITEVFSVTLGQALAALTPTTFISSQFDPFIMITFALFCGVTIPAVQMPYGYRAWLYELDPFTRLISGMVTTALNELPVICQPAELNSFNAPGGSTCGDYMQPFFNNGGAGYLVDNSTSSCEYCAYKSGNQFYQPLGMDFGNRWRDLGIFLSFVGSNIIIILVASRFLNFNRR